jgi:formate dehydrogenase alpha subunit
MLILLPVSMIGEPQNAMDAASVCKAVQRRRLAANRYRGEFEPKILSTKQLPLVHIAGWDASLRFVNSSERLRKPLIKRDGKFIEAEWPQALDLVAEQLLALKKKHGSDAIMGLASAKVTNEENFVFQKFMRAVVGANNVDHCARLCHASTVAGLAAAFGSGAMTNTIAELEQAEVILVTGSNTTETHPVIATYIKRALKYNQTKLIVIEPRRIELAKYADLWLAPKNGTDVAWINGLLHIMINADLINHDFIAKRTEGFTELKQLVAKYTPEYTATITGIPPEQLIMAAKIYAQAKHASIVYAMGITQHVHGTDNVKSLANLAMATGNIGRKSTGVNPLRGQNNVQGSCDMGALPDVYSGYQKVSDPKCREKFEKAWGVSLPANNGITLTEMFDQVINGKIKALYFMGENPALADANISHVKQALEETEFLVCQDIFPTETTAFADVVFPSASCAEKDGTFTNTERRVLPVRKIMEPVGEAQPDWWIVQELAKRMGYAMHYNSAQDIMREINALTPSYAGITSERIAKGEKLQWPCLTTDHPGTSFLHQERFAKGQGTFFAIEYMPPKELPDSDYPYTLSTGRILYHYHTATMTRKTAVLPKYTAHAFAEINPKDAKELGTKNEDKIRVTSRRGAIVLDAKITDKVSEKNIFIPFHFVEAAANLLTNDALDPLAKIPEYKVCACRVEKI